MIVGQRREFYQNFSYDSHLRLHHIFSGKSVKFRDNGSEIVSELLHGRLFPAQGLDARLLPLLVKSVGASRFGLVGTGGVEHPHKDIAVHNCL